jgi:hypothetical protein
MGIAARFLSAALLSASTACGGSGSGWAQTPSSAAAATEPGAGMPSVTVPGAPADEAAALWQLSTTRRIVMHCRLPGETYTPWDEKMNCAVGDEGAPLFSDLKPDLEPDLTGPDPFQQLWLNSHVSPLYRVDFSSDDGLGGAFGFGRDFELAQAVAPAPPAEAQAPAAAPAASPAPAPAPAPAPRMYTVPAGTKVLLELRSAVNTKSAKPGDGVYLTSIFPVTVGNRVMIPVGVYVQGVVDRVIHPDRGGRKAQLDMHFTSMIFPNGTVVEIPGVVDALPGAKQQTVKDGDEGTIQQDGDKGRNAAETAKVAIPAGGGIGTIGGAVSGHPIEGGLAGLGVGAAAVGLVSLFTRNADLDIPSGTQVEMELQRPLILEEENVAAAGSAAAPAPLVPAPGQQKPIDKPNQTQILCPPGSLGCR